MIIRFSFNFTIIRARQLEMMNDIMNTTVDI